MMKRTAKKAPSLKALRARHDRLMRTFDKNRGYYYSHKNELLKKYKGKYVAIWDDSVVGIGSDVDELSERVYAEKGRKPVFFTLVAEHPQVVRFPSISLLRKPSHRA